MKNIEIEDAIKNYERHCSHKYESNATKNNYIATVKLFKKHLQREVSKTSDINTENYITFMDKLSRVKRVGKDVSSTCHRQSTKATHYARFMIFIRYLFDKKYIEEFTLESFIKIRPKAPRYTDSRAIKPEEFEKIYSSIALYKHENVLSKKRDLAILTTLYYSGVRKNELLNLKVCDIDFKNKSIRIEGATSKSKETRYVAMSKKLSIPLQDYLDERSKYGMNDRFLFISIRKGTQLTGHGMKHWVIKYVKESGIKFHLHRFRHSFACNLNNLGASLITISRVMGHTNTITTQAYVRSVDSKSAREYILAL